MSLIDLQHQIETATLVSDKLESDAKSKGGFSRVRTGIRKEFTAFKKVLENSKSRLQELQAMQDDLKALEIDDESQYNCSHSAATSTRSTRTGPFSPVAKSPYWLPALGRKKTSFFAGTSMEARVSLFEAQVVFLNQ